MDAYWMLLLAALVIGAQGTLFKKTVFRKLKYSRSFQVSSCYEGDKIELMETIENRKAIPVPWLRVESRFRSGLLFGSQLNLDISEGQHSQNHKSFFSLMPWTKIVRRHHITAARRGVYKLGTVTMTSGDLLGLSSTVRNQSLQGQLTVYPNPLDIQNMELPVRTWIGDLVVRRWIMEDPFLQSGVRAYRSGDPLKDIHWKASARAGSLQVHQRDTTADGQVLIYLNVEDHEQMWTHATKPEPIEYGIRVTAGIIVHLLSQGMEAGFGTNGMLEEEPETHVSIPVTGGKYQQEHILSTLARLELTRRMSFHDYLGVELDHLEETRDILILSTYISPRLEEMLGQFTSRGHTVTIHSLHQVDCGHQEVTA